MTIDRKPPIGSAVFAANGTALVRDLPPGPVELRLRDGQSEAASHRAQPVIVPGEEAPKDSFYAETSLAAGFNYLPTRDGTTLSAFVTLPGSAQGGPYPSLVEYFGYSPSDPTNGEDPYRLLIPALDYALVQIKVRGTGCSGGSFDAFEGIQSQPQPVDLPHHREHRRRTDRLFVLSGRTGRGSHPPPRMTPRTNR